MFVLEKTLDRVSVALALMGGVILCALIVMSVLSITGRGLSDYGFKPVPGDFELIEMGVGVAIFWFLPLCQMRRGHVSVDLFMRAFGPRVNLVIDLIANALMSVFAVLIAWRLILGAMDKTRFGETTYILQAPLYIGYWLAVVGAAVFVLTAVYSVIRSHRELNGFDTVILSDDR